MAGELREGDFQFGRLIWGDTHRHLASKSLSVCSVQFVGYPAQDTIPSPGEQRPFPTARAGLTHVADLWLCQP